MTYKNLPPSFGSNLPEKGWNYAPPSEPIWITVREAATLLGVSVTAINKACRSGRFKITQADGNGGKQNRIELKSLIDSRPEADRHAIWQRWLDSQQKLECIDTAPPTIPAVSAEVVPPAPVAKSRSRRQGLPAISQDEYEALWATFELKPSGVKKKSELALAAISEFFRLRQIGASVTEASAAIDDQFGIDSTTLWRWRKRIDGHDHAHWLPLLAPDWKGRNKRADISEAAWDYILARYLNTSKTKLSVIYKLALKESESRAWVLPSIKTVQRMVDELPTWMKTAGREGQEAVARAYPAQRRDYTTLKLHELWESDGRKADVFCRWPDGSVGRPVIVIWREVRTRMVLGVRGFKNTCAAVVVLAFRQALERSGATPLRALMDNGREYASKVVTGGQKTRYRFKISETEPPGVMTLIGTEAQWATPYHGQAKPVESFWRYIAEHVDQLPEFQGAYVGRNTVEKPEDCSPNKAIPLEAYGAKLAEAIETFNQRPHRGRGMNGKSPFELYEALSREAVVRRPTAAHLRMLLLGVKVLRLDSRDASVSFNLDGFGAVRYWTERLADLPRSKPYNVYYDPESPAQPVAIYDGERYICDAPPIGLTAFLDRAAGKEHAKAKGNFLKSRKASLRSIKESSPVLLPQVVGPAALSPLPQPKHALVIDAPMPPPEPESPIERLKNGDVLDKASGEIVKRVASRLPDIPAEDAGEDEDLERLRSAQREKNLPNWMKKQTG